MKFVYTRLGSARAPGSPGTTDAGWLGGASARGLPRRHAWTRYLGRNGQVSSQWRDMPLTAPAPQHQPMPTQDGQESYILQQDPTGLWFVDAWGSAGSGTIRPAINHDAPPLPAPGDLSDTCFIIELERAQHG